MDVLKVIIKIYKVIKNKKYVFIIWINKEIRDSFLENKKIINYKYKDYISN
jgi:hypothetical protein